MSKEEKIDRFFEEMYLELDKQQSIKNWMELFLEKQAELVKELEKNS